MKKLNCEKRIIEVSCNKSSCSHYSICCKVATEVIYTKEDKDIDLLIVGQGAGKDEEIIHRPFVGISGTYLRSMLVHIWETTKFNLALSNTVRCRPFIESETIDKKKVKKDREPTKEEIETCIPHLWKDIVELKPKAILTVGKSSLSSLVKVNTSSTMTSLRGERFSSRGYDVIATWHPAYLTRLYHRFNANKLQKEDLETIQDISTSLNLSPVSYQCTLEL